MRYGKRKKAKEFLLLCGYRCFVGPPTLVYTFWNDEAPLHVTFFQMCIEMFLFMFRVQRILKVPLELKLHVPSFGPNPKSFIDSSLIIKQISSSFVRLIRTTLLMLWLTQS
jgi:hypothetical protein